MPSNFNTFKYAFLGTLLFVATILAAYQLLYAIPQKKCEAAGDWWSFRYRQCAQPMRIVDLTGRHKPSSGAPSASGSASASTSAAGHP
jgi:hypothetical protein